MGQGAESLEFQNEGISFEDVLEEYIENLSATIEVLKQRYSANKIASVGTQIVCPACGKKHMKKSYQSQFCSNKGKKNCKDRYNNTINTDRRIQALHQQGNDLALFLEGCIDGYDEYDIEEFYQKF